MFTKIEEMATSIAGMIGEGPNNVVGHVSYTKQTKGNSKPAMRNYKYSKIRSKKQDNINEDSDMKEIIKVMLQEGIDEETIHEVLAVIEESYEVSEGILKNIKDGVKNTVDNVKNYIEKEKRFHRLAKEAPNTEVGQSINNDKEILKDTQNKMISLSKRADRYKKKGLTNAYNSALAQGRNLYGAHMGALKRVSQKEIALTNAASRRGMNAKDATRFTNSFTNKGNKNVVKTTYDRVK